MFRYILFFVAWPRFRRLTKLLVRCFLIAIVTMLTLFGIFNVLESSLEKNIPKCSKYFGDANPRKTSNSILILEGTSDEQRWNGLTPALNILESVQPDVKKWVIDYHNAGKIVFVENFEKTTAINAHAHICKFDCFERKLIIHRGLFAENDGTIAALLCHEYRHSKQSYFKIFRYAISFYFHPNGNDDIVENDAELYEHEAYHQIFGLDYPFELED